MLTKYGTLWLTFPPPLHLDVAMRLLLLTSCGQKWRVSLLGQCIEGPVHDFPTVSSSVLVTKRSCFRSCIYKIEETFISRSIWMATGSSALTDMHWQALWTIHNLWRGSTTDTFRLFAPVAYPRLSYKSLPRASAGTSEIKSNNFSMWQPFR